MKYLLVLFLSISLSACSQNERTHLGKEFAENELNLALSKQSQHNVIDNETLILKDSSIAVSVAEPILFQLYGKENIESEKPYEIHFIKNYWLITGTLPQDSVGGTFMIILDAKNAQIIKITHGK